MLKCLTTMVSILTTCTLIGAVTAIMKSDWMRLLCVLKGLTPLHVAVLSHNAVVKEVRHMENPCSYMISELAKRRRRYVECVRTLMQMGASYGTKVSTSTSGYLLVELSAVKIVCNFFYFVILQLSLQYPWREQLVVVHITEQEFYPILLCRVVLIWHVFGFKVILVGFKSQFYLHHFKTNLSFRGGLSGAWSCYITQVPDMSLRILWFHQLQEVMQVLK